MPSPRVLITGVAGYLGTIIAEHLLRAGCRVSGLDNLHYGDAGLFHLCADPSFEFVLGDARDKSVLAPLIKDADIILPLAAIVGTGACDRNSGLTQSVNVDAIRLMTRLRSPSQLVIFPMTNSGYGARTGDVFCTEETPLEPISLYGRTKVEAEKMVLESPNSISLRLATVFGLSPRMRLDLLVNHFVYAAVTDGYIVIFEKDFKRNYIHIRDVADSFLHCIGRSAQMAGSAYNVGLDNANLSKEELALKVKGYVPRFYIHFAAVGTDPDQRNYIVSNQRLRDAGFEARRTIDSGIQELLKGYRSLGRSRFKNV